MAHLKNGILNAGSGRIGSVILYNMYGKSYMRSMPTTYRDQKSPLQLQQRMKMQLITQFMRPFGDLFKITYASEAIGKSAYHAAKSCLLKNGIQGEYPHLELDKTRLLISKGNLETTDQATAQLSDRTLDVKWDTNQPNEHKGQHHQILMVAANDQCCDIAFINATRRDGQLTWQSSLFTPASPTDVWMAFYQPMTHEISNSVYLGNFKME